MEHDLTVADIARKAGCSTLAVVSKWDVAELDIVEAQGHLARRFQQRRTAGGGEHRVHHQPPDAVVAQPLRHGADRGGGGELAGLDGIGADISERRIDLCRHHHRRQGVDAVAAQGVLGVDGGDGGHGVHTEEGQHPLVHLQAGTTCGVRARHTQHPRPDRCAHAMHPFVRAARANPRSVTGGG